ncbi:Urea ABC transporter, permease protein UrtB [Rhodovulum sp. PH10]|uniref:urea ABC transporter permease subunit UrtB n=1 Tax=Rhodovulum sp. PH10 TaxID=1187851 RepID=UPI00027C286C|nr:urea ABC transporter permease subunit UrtB [Rhodovulum sp. PH10]EJW13469.1 Urea ABC transporter, permease protein UrtB [Rhodovulum sp. PH10]
MSIIRWLVVLSFAVGVLLAAPPVGAAPYEDALANLSGKSFKQTEQAIDALGASADERAAPVLRALLDGRLSYDPAGARLVVEGADGALRDAMTGDVITSSPADLDRIRINNRLRRAIAAALGTLTLRAADPARRRAAAEAVYKSRDAGSLEALEAALAAETDPGVKQAMTEARAAILLDARDTPDLDRLAAIGVLRARGDQSALALLTSLPDDTPDTVKRTADAAADAIRSDLKLWEAGQNTWYGVSLGSVLLLAAIGLAITFGVMGVINMAHGEMVMLGAYTTFVVQEVIRQQKFSLWIPGTDIGTTLPLPFPVSLDWSLPIAVPLAFLVTALIGILIERSVIRFLYGRPLETLLATWGLSLVLQQAVRTAFGPTNKEVSNPSWMSGAFEIGHLVITYNRLWIVCFSLAVFATLLLMLRFTRLGLEMRAVTQNRAMAASVGIRTGRIDALTFGLGSGIAGIAGVALSQIDNVSPNLGQGYIIDSFMVVVFGGVGNLWGTLVGAFTLGIANKFLEPFAGAVLGKILILVLLILFIQRRPRGLFALAGRAVEA